MSEVVAGSPEPSPVTVLPPPVPAPVKLEGYPDPLTPVRWSPWVVAGAVVAFFVGVVGLGLLLFSVPGFADVDGSIGSASRLAAYAIPYVLVVVVIGVAVARSGAPWSEAVGLRPFVIVSGIALAVAGAVVGRVVVTLVTVIITLIGVQPPESDITRLFPLDTAGMVSIFLLTVIVAPVVEELLFRGVVFPAVRQRYGTLAGVLGSSALFGLAHFDPWLVIPTTVFGMMLAQLYLATRSLWVPIITHALFNLTAVIALYAMRAAGLI